MDIRVIALPLVPLGLALSIACSNTSTAAETPAAAEPEASRAEEIVPTRSGAIRVEHQARLVEPWGMALLPDGSLLITEKPGRMRIYANGTLSEPIGGLPKIEYRGQGGLLDVEIDPGFAQNRLVYFSYSEAAYEQPPDAQEPGDPRFGEFQDKSDVVLKGGAVARARLEGSSLQEVTVIWRQVPKTIGRGHFAGRLVFAPDGKLFITSGDRQRFDPAQDLNSNLGKVVRINPDGTIPPDNPFANRAGYLPEIWSAGHRNPLGAAINPATQHLWIHEMGPAHGDEINIPEAGKNYGWPMVSNGDNYDGTIIPDHAARPEFGPPLYYWHPAVSPSGLMFYTGTLFKDWNGNALAGGLSSETLLRLTIEGNRVKSEERIGVRRRIRDVLQLPDGSIVLLTDYKDGELLRLTPADAKQTLSAGTPDKGRSSGPPA